MQKKFILILAATLGLVGCSGGGSANQSSDADPRMLITNQALTTQGLLGQLNLTLTATILPPTVGGTTLNANDIYVYGTSAYVSYNIPGEVHLGAIDQINMSNVSVPVRTASTTFADSTINGVFVTGGNAYAVGSTSQTLSTGWSAFITQLGVGATAFTTPLKTLGLLNTYAGTGVMGWNGSLYALSGANGNSTSYGVSVLNPTTLAQTTSISIQDARGLDAYAGGGTDLWVIAGGGMLYDINSSNVIAHSVNVGGNSIPQSKSTVQVGKTMVAVSNGDGGFSIICQADRRILASMPQVTVSGLASTATVTNAVAVGPGLLFAADGEAGLYVYKVTSGFPTTSVCNSVTLSSGGSVSFGSTPYSVNNVRYVNGNLYVATGLGGFKVIAVSLLAPLISALNDFL